MRRFFALAALLWASPALAQTTTWNPSDAGAGITLSGGNLVATTSATNVFKTVRGTVPKYSGQWCYQFTVNNPTSNFSIGVANSEWPLTYQALLGYTDFNIASYAYESAGLNSSTGTVLWRFAAAGSSDPPVNGQTGEVCVNLDLLPPVLWVTPNVSGTSGPGGGPKWNGDAAATPVGNVGGRQVLLPRYLWFPTFSGYNADKVTAAFGGFTPPSGYSTWNTSGGGSPVPGPVDPLNVYVSNAPGWTTGTSHALKDRINAGAGWNGTAFTNGQPVCVFGLTVAGSSGSDPTVFNTACASGTAAGVGGGLDGTIPAGWSGATTVVDGGATWALLQRIDYATLTGAFSDDPLAWGASTTFQFTSVVTHAGNAYLQNTNISFTPSSCVSAGSGGPTGTGNQITDGTCKWDYVGAIGYTSGAHQFSHVLGGFTGVWYGVQTQHAHDTNIIMIYGGAQRPRYQDGVAGEGLPIPVYNHEAMSLFDGTTYCYKHGSLALDGNLIQNPTSTTEISCNGLGTPYVWKLTTFPGDSFVDNMNVATSQLNYDETKGVSFYSTSAATPDISYAQPINLRDVNFIVEKMQFKSTNGSAISSLAGNMMYQNNILYSGGGPGVIFADADAVLRNNLLISTTTEAGCYAILFKYRGVAYNNTAVGPGNANCTFIANYDSSGIGVYNPTTGLITPWRNNLVFGFPNFHAYGTQGHSLLFDIGNNAGDYSATPSITPFTLAADAPIGGTYTPVNMTSGYNSTCGVGNSSPCTGLSASVQFVNSTVGTSFDGRLLTGAGVIGAGANFNATVVPYWQGAFSSTGTDILGNTRPTSSRFDVGVIQFNGTPAPCVINSVSLSGTHTFPGGSPSGYNVGTMSASLSGSCAASAWSITSTGSDHSSTACNAASGTDFQAVSTNFELNTTLPAATYADICYTNTISGATGSPYTQAVTITGIPAVTPAGGSGRRGGMFR